MSRHRRRRREPNRKGTTKPGGPISSPGLHADRLHRRPCLWDVFIHELSKGLTLHCMQAAHHASADTFRFDDDESTRVGWMLARGFEILVAQDWAGQPCEGLGRKLWQLDEPTVVQISENTAYRCFEPLLRKYMEDSRGIYYGWPHPDLTPLVWNLGAMLGGFLLVRGIRGADLYRCLEDPLADHGRYFPDTGRPAGLPEASGDPFRDVQQLGLMIDDSDDGGDLKHKLVHFVRNDPWLFAECAAFVEGELERAAQWRQWVDSGLAVDEATDTFIFRATHLAGKTPIQVLLERRRDISDRQRERLLRWDREIFCGMFVVDGIDLPFLQTRDLRDDQSFTLEATKPGGLANVRVGDLLFSRVAPWDDHWLLSGIQHRFEGAGKKPEFLAKLRHQAGYGPLYRRLDPDDPHMQQAFAMQEAHYQAWMDLFGGEELVLPDGLALGAAMNRFYRYWNDEVIVPDRGLTRSELYRREHGHARPDIQFPLPDHLLKATDTAAVFDRRHGLAFYVGYGLFRSAFADGEAPLTAEQAERVWDYLTAESVDFWLFQRMRDRYPARTEEVFKHILKDQRFQLDRDFDAILGKFKGQAMRQPLRPMITVVDVKTEKTTPGRVLT
ncbi:MAG TPA: hypothetical protein ENN81_04395 [Phycisphaerales bacterium]|nr:hypothetical protein [Phycisphaerales bacterium]